MADPLWINADAGAPAYSANELRQAMAVAMQWGGRVLGARQGVRPGGNQLFVSLAGSTITVNAGVALLDPALTTPQGPYWVAIPANEQHTLQAAHATNPRKDIVVLRVYDHDEDASGLRLARTEYIAGTANAVPVEPAVPAGAIRLAHIDVPQSGGGSPVVTDRRIFTVAAGGIIPVPDQAGRDAISLPYAGMACWRADTKTIEVHDGTAWRVRWGFVAESVRTTSVGPFTGDTVIQSATFTAVAGIRYEVTAVQSYQSSQANDLVRLRLRWQAGPTLTTGGTEFYAVEPNCDVAGRGQPVTLIKSLTGLSGQVTVGVTAARVGGGGNITMFGEAGRQVNLVQVKAV